MVFTPQICLQSLENQSFRLGSGLSQVDAACSAESCPSADLARQLAPFPQLSSVLLRPAPLDPLNPQRRRERTAEGLWDVFHAHWLHFIALNLHLNIETVQFLYSDGFYKPRASWELPRKPRSAQNSLLGI